jgi:adenylate kinase family enzyme
MYLDSNDYQTVWNLAHKWANSDPESNEIDKFPEEVKLNIHRITAAIFRNQLPARNKKRVILIDNSLLAWLIDFRHFKILRACINNDFFDKSYLNSIYVRRTHVISWCEKEYLPVPYIWDNKSQTVIANSEYDSSDDENDNWYNDLTERRKNRVACLELAKKLWKISPNKSYEQIYNDPTMKQFGNPNVFSLESFKKWARPFAPDQIKEGGRPIKIK